MPNIYEQLFGGGAESPFPKTGADPNFQAQVATAGQAPQNWIPQGAVGRQKDPKEEARTQQEFETNQRAANQRYQQNEQSFKTDQARSQQQMGAFEKNQQRTDQAYNAEQQSLDFIRRYGELMLEAETKAPGVSRDLKMFSTTPQNVRESLSMDRRQEANEQAMGGGNPLALLSDADPAKTPVLSLMGNSMAALLRGFVEETQSFAGNVTAGVLKTKQYQDLDPQSKAQVIEYLRKDWDYRTDQKAKRNRAIVDDARSEIALQRDEQLLKNAKSEEDLVRLQQEREERMTRRFLDDPRNMTKDELADRFETGGAVSSAISPRVRRGTLFGKGEKAAQNRAAEAELLDEIESNPEYINKLSTMDPNEWSSFSLQRLGYPSQERLVPKGETVMDRKSGQEIYVAGRRRAEEVFFGSSATSNQESAAMGNRPHILWLAPGGEGGARERYEKTVGGNRDALKRALYERALGELVAEPTTKATTGRMAEKPTGVDWSDIDKLFSEGQAEVVLPGGEKIPASMYFSEGFRRANSDLYRGLSDVSDRPMPGSIAERTGISPAQARLLVDFTRDSILGHPRFQSILSDAKNHASEYGFSEEQAGEAAGMIISEYFRQANLALGQGKSLNEFNQEWDEGRGSEKVIQHIAPTMKIGQRVESRKARDRAGYDEATLAIRDRLEVQLESDPGSVLAARDLTMALEARRKFWDAEGSLDVTMFSRDGRILGGVGDDPIANRVATDWREFTPERWPWQEKPINDKGRPHGTPGHGKFIYPEFMTEADFADPKARDAGWAYMATKDAVNDAMAKGENPLIALTTFFSKSPWSSGKVDKDRRLILLEQWFQEMNASGKPNPLMEAILSQWLPKQTTLQGAYTTEPPPQNPEAALQDMQGNPSRSPFDMLQAQQEIQRRDAMTVPALPEPKPSRK